MGVWNAKLYQAHTDARAKQKSPKVCFLHIKSFLNSSFVHGSRIMYCIEPIPNRIRGLKIVETPIPSSQAFQRHKAPRHSFWLWRPELRSVSTLRLQHAQRRFLAYVLIKDKLHFPALQEAWLNCDFGPLRTRDAKIFLDSWITDAIKQRR